MVCSVPLPQNLLLVCNALPEHCSYQCWQKLFWAIETVPNNSAAVFDDIQTRFQSHEGVEELGVIAPQILAMESSGKDAVDTG